MEKMKLAALSVTLLTACGNVEGLTSEDIFGLRASASAWLFGQVTNGATGAPLPGVAVSVQGYSTQTDHNGAYRIEGLVGRSTTASASIHGFHPYNVPVALMSGENRLDMALAPNECGRFNCADDEFCSSGTCVRGAVLTGSVVSDCSGAALDARVTINGKSGCSLSRSGKAYFELSGLTPGGPHTLSVGKSGYQAFSKAMTLTPGFNVFETVRLVPIGGCPAGEPAPVACTCTDPSCQ